MRKPFFFVLLLFFSLHGFSQELNCLVKISADRIETSDKRIFMDMEKAFTDFLNNRKWTNDVFKPQERIHCVMNITLQDNPSVGVYTGTVQIQSGRPVYDTNYETTLLNYGDRNWQFEYSESQPLNFAENSFNSNLTSMLAYYAYVIIGLDYDSFGELSGSPYLEKARAIVQQMQQSSYPGWKQFENNKNRYWLIDNLLNTQLKPVREAIYTYHRQGLDIFYKDAEKGRAAMLEALKDIQKANKAQPNALFTGLFMDAKSKEIINAFSQGNMQVRREAFDILNEIDPSKRDEYQAIIK